MANASNDVAPKTARMFLTTQNLTLLLEGLRWLWQPFLSLFEIYRAQRLSKTCRGLPCWEMLLPGVGVTITKKGIEHFAILFITQALKYAFLLLMHRQHHDLVYKLMVKASSFRSAHSCLMLKVNTHPALALTIRVVGLQSHIHQNSKNKLSFVICYLLLIAASYSHSYSCY